MFIVSVLAHRTNVFAPHVAHGEEREQKEKLSHAPLFLGTNHFFSVNTVRTQVCSVSTARESSNLFEKIHATPPSVKE
jgi:hypothetical protein